MDIIGEAVWRLIATILGFIFDLFSLISYRIAILVVLFIILHFSGYNLPLALGYGVLGLLLYGPSIYRVWKKSSTVR